MKEHLSCSICCPCHGSQRSRLPVPPRMELGGTSIRCTGAFTIIQYKGPEARVHIRPYKQLARHILRGSCRCSCLNLLCLVYLLLHSGFVTDFTDPQNLFTLAINSPPSFRVKGCCGSGPVKGDFTIPWQVGYAPKVNHYFFKEGRDKSLQDGSAEEDVDALPKASPEGSRGAKFRALSNSKRWL